MMLQDDRHACTNLEVDKVSCWKTESVRNIALAEKMLAVTSNSCYDDKQHQQQAVADISVLPGNTSNTPKNVGGLTGGNSATWSQNHGYGDGGSPPVGDMVFPGDNCIKTCEPEVELFPQKETRPCLQIRIFPLKRWLDFMRQQFVPAHLLRSPVQRPQMCIVSTWQTPFHQN